MPELPTPVRAALGLAATMVDEARTLPDKAIELPMLAVSKTLQLTLRMQRGYAALAARGDELLANRSVGDEPPAWATFDAPVSDADGDASPFDDLAPRGAAGRPRSVRKTVRAPRDGAPSAFDSVADE
jgi:hypothetical protein